MKSIPARVEASQRVRTGLKSWATLSFPDKTRIEMGANSYVTLAPADETGAELSLDLGTIHAWVVKLVTRKRFIVHTPAVDMAVRGTEFTVEIGDGRPLRSLHVFSWRPSSGVRLMPPRSAGPAPPATIIGTRPAIGARRRSRPGPTPPPSTPMSPSRSARVRPP
ncbi:MAG: FecR domain-containing protein [Elusimicrobia bacterium]|nr:FecR domain-containing protein [Elusimicrobiota bacterium]